MLSNLESIQSNQSLQKLQKRPILDQNSSKKWHHSILSSMLIQLLTHLMVGIIHHVMSHNYNYNRIYLKGLECLHRQLSSQFKVLTKSHVHSTATGTKCDLFKNSPLGTKDTRKGIWDHQYATDEDGPFDTNWWLRGLFICDSSFVDLLTDYQIIFTVIYTCATDDLTAFIGNSRLTGISSVTRFIGRILDIYPPQVNIPILFNCYIFRSRMSKSKIIWIWQILLVILIHQRKRKWQTQRFWINTLQRKRYFWMSNMPWQHFL